MNFKYSVHFRYWNSNGEEISGTDSTNSLAEVYAREESVKRQGGTSRCDINSWKFNPVFRKEAQAMFPWLFQSPAAS